MSLELQTAVPARAVDERQLRAARRARITAQVDLVRTLAGERLAPVTAQEVREPFEIILLDQEVRLGPSAFAGPRRTTDERGDVTREAAIAQRLHVSDRSGHRRNEWQPAQQLFGLVDLHVDHFAAV